MAGRVSKVKSKETKPHVRPKELSQLELDEALTGLAAWKLVQRPNSRAKTGHATELHRNSHLSLSRTRCISCWQPAGASSKWTTTPNGTILTRVFQSG